MGAERASTVNHRKALLLRLDHQPLDHAAAGKGDSRSEI
jgi:hypothetical protein